MSWDAYFSAEADGQLIPVKDWNYTHNTNKMINAVLGEDRLKGTHNPWWIALNKNATEVDQGSWWDLLDGLSGKAGTELLDLITAGLAADLDRFRAMNPSNGWGDVDSLITVLAEMADTSRSLPSGEWRVSG